MKKITNERIIKFKNYLIEEERAEATVEKYIRDVMAFMEWLCGKEVTKAIVIEYKHFIMEQYAPRSVNSMLSSINSFFQHNEWHDCIVKTLKIQKQIFADRDKELTREEYERLLVAAEKKSNRRLYMLMQTICATGIRISELKYVTVSSVQSKQALINCKGKMRVVILPKKLCKMLKTYIKENNIKSGPVFVSKNGKSLDRSNVWKMLKALCESAGVSKDKVFPHNFRHLFARTFYSLQKDIVRLADILGHSSVNTTRIYTMETCEIHRDLIQKLGLLRC